MNEQAYQKLLDEMNGYMRACVLAATAELDVATKLLDNSNSLSAEELARLCATDPWATGRLLDTLVGMDYLSKAHGRYSVKEEFKELLHSGAKESFIPMIRHSACIMRSWTRLSWVVRDGKADQRQPSILGAEEDAKSFIMGMNSMALRLVDGVVEDLQKARVFPLKDGASFIDVGGASGTYTEAFLNVLPGSKATIFDLPVAVELAKRRFGDHPLKDRVSIVQGDFYKDDLPEGFDMAWVSAIIHSMNREQGRALYAKILKALKPGGLILIRDFIMSRDHTRPVDGTLFGINMLVNNATGRVFSYAEIREDLEAAGYVDVFQVSDVPTMCAMAAGKKPA